jgi:type IV pilus assembly protein PilW
VVIFQVLTASDARNRTTNAGGDAQMAGTVAMYLVERDIKMGGMGFGTSTSAYTGCSVSVHNAALTPTDFNINLLPVEIVKGTGAAPDAINVLYSNSQYFVAAQPLDAATATTKRLRSRAGFQRGDVAVVAGKESAGGTTLCSMVEINVDNDVDGLTLGHTTAAYTSFYGGNKTPVYNKAGGFGGALTEGRLFNLGPAPHRTEWRVVGNADVPAAYRRLTQRNSLTETAVSTVAEGVVNMKAQYGVDGANGEPIDNAITDAEWTDSVPADATLLRAVRVALLVRSQQFEAPLTNDSGTAVSITPTAPSWSGGTFEMTNLDGSSGSSTPGGAIDWRNYRYRVYESVIPLRNMIWGTAP